MAFGPPCLFSRGIMTKVIVCIIGLLIALLFSVLTSSYLLYHSVEKLPLEIKQHSWVWEPQGSKAHTPQPSGRGK